MYFEAAPFIPVTFMAFAYMIILPIRLMGPNTPQPEKGKPFPLRGVAFYGYTVGLYIIYMQTVTLISLTYKPYFGPLYIFESNRFLYTLIIYMLAVWFIVEYLLVQSKWTAIITTAGTVFILAGLTVIYSAPVSPDTIFKNSFIFVLLSGFVIWCVLVFVPKLLKKERSDLTNAIYAAPEKIRNIVISRKNSVIFMVILYIMTLITWADIPVL